MDKTNFIFPSVYARSFRSIPLSTAAVTLLAPLQPTHAPVVCALDGAPRDHHGFEALEVQVRSVFVS
jgi:hypothetical protein